MRGLVVGELGAVEHPGFVVELVVVGRGGRKEWTSLAVGNTVLSIHLDRMRSGSRGGVVAVYGRAKTHGHVGWRVGLGEDKDTGKCEQAPL